MHKGLTTLMPSLKISSGRPARLLCSTLSAPPRLNPFRNPRKKLYSFAPFCTVLHPFAPKIFRHFSTHLSRFDRGKKGLQSPQFPLCAASLRKPAKQPRCFAETAAATEGTEGCEALPSAISPLEFSLFMETSLSQTDRKPCNHSRPM